jgi:prolyl oligopeptidase
MSLKGAVEEVIHGTQVRDPYRWLEDRNRAETKEWIRTQQDLCREYFDSCPGLSAIEQRVRDYLDVEVVDQPAQIGNRFFYRKRSIGQEQGAIYTRGISGGDERILVSPSPADRFMSVGIHRFAPNGSLVAYEVKHGGGDRKEIRFVDVSTGAVLPNRIPLGYARGLSFSQHGYFYCHENDSSADEHSIFYEPFDTAKEKTVVFRVPRSKASKLILSANQRWLGAILLHPEGSNVLTDFWVAPAMDRRPDWVQVFHSRPAPYSPLLCHDRILVLANTAAGNSRLIELSTQGEELGVFASECCASIQQITVMRDRIVVICQDHGITKLDALLLSGERTSPIDLPRGGTVQILPAYEQNAENFFYSFESFDIPPRIYQYHAQSNTSLLWYQRWPADRTRPSSVREATVPSKDGSRIPLTLVTSQGERTQNSPRPVVMTGYGGFGVTITPRFSVLAAILMEAGAVFALAHIRGGGEFGKAWHDGGCKRKRQTGFDDFIAAAEWMCGNGMTTPRQLGIFGGSHSGLLVGAALTQRPDLFGAVLCIAPLLDMVRYERFDQAAKWRMEYGAVGEPEDFQALLELSPYHRIVENADYPPTLFVTGDKDDRCNPAHTRKMAALLQERPAQTSPVIVDYCEERGHSPVLPLSLRIPALARRIAFFCRELHIAVPDGGFNEAPHS